MGLELPAAVGRRQAGAARLPQSALQKAVAGGRRASAVNSWQGFIQLHCQQNRSFIETQLQAC